MPELTVVSFNMHWGRGERGDGWPSFDYLEACRGFDADVLVLQESWAPDGGLAQHAEIATALDMDVVSVPMARAVLEPKPKLMGRADPDHEVGAGDWSLALLSRKPIRASRVIDLPRLFLDPWRRALVLAELDVDGTNLTVAAVHFSHLEFGAPLHTRALRRALPTTDRPAAFVGDMNMWGWTISAMVPKGWRRVVKGKTWPSHRPKHQIDHVLVTPTVEVVSGEVLPDLGSDHRAVRVRLRVT